MFPVAAAVFTDNATLPCCQSMAESASLCRRAVTAAGRRARLGASQLVQLLMQQDLLPEANLLWLCQYFVSACLWALVPSMDLGKCNGLLQRAPVRLSEVPGMPQTPARLASAPLPPAWAQAQPKSNIVFRRGPVCWWMGLCGISLSGLCVNLRFWCRRQQALKTAPDGWKMKINQHASPA